MDRPRDAQGRYLPKPIASDPEMAVPTGEAGVASDDFLLELQASWARHGAATIETVRRDRPHDYLRLMASSLAKRVEAPPDAVQAMSDDEIADELRHILEQLAATGAGPGA